MDTNAFYQRIIKIAAQPPYNRYGLLAEFHTEVVIRYLNIIQTMTEREAKRTSADGRTIGQVVGHIAEWERFIILAAGEMVVGVQWPRIMDLCGYMEPDGQLHDFASVDDFNDYQAAKHATWSWKSIQNQAIHAATALHTLFTQPALLSPELLEQTKNYQWSLPNGLRLTVPAGWYLWMVSIEHEMIEHAADLGWKS
jgi:hypothetical protein